MNSIFVYYTINSCDITVHVLEKKVSENANVGLETQIQTDTWIYLDTTYFC